MRSTGWKVSPAGPAVDDYDAPGQSEAVNLARLEEIAVRPVPGAQTVSDIHRADDAAQQRAPTYSG